MALVTPSVTVDQKDGICMEVAGRDHRFFIDQPKENGGSDKGMSPVEALLGSFGACLNMMTLHLAGLKNIPITHLKVQVEGDLDLEGQPRPGFQQIRLHYDVQSPAPADQVKALIEEAEQCCPVGDTLRNGTSLVLNGVEVSA